MSWIDHGAFLCVCALLFGAQASAAELPSIVAPAIAFSLDIGAKTDFRPRVALRINYAEKSPETLDARAIDRSGARFGDSSLITPALAEWSFFSGGTQTFSMNGLPLVTHKRLQNSADSTTPPEEGHQTLWWTVGGVAVATAAVIATAGHHNGSDSSSTATTDCNGANAGSTCIPCGGTGPINGCMQNPTDSGTQFEMRPEDDALPGDTGGMGDLEPKLGAR